ncbi:MAG TPA: hypothetical protein VH414_18910 [Lichenihabitans sp.]|nr:hypothetical protein [Lichenihabitans sp.]
MRHAIVMVALASATLGLGATVARADCESDMIQLEQAYKTPNLTPAGKAALDQAKDQSVTAMRKDDDAGCHKAIADALPKAGLTLK